jgi:hypothetical protein
MKLKTTEDAAERYSKFTFGDVHPYPLADHAIRMLGSDALEAHRLHRNEIAIRAAISGVHSDSPQIYKDRALAAILDILND